MSAPPPYRLRSGAVHPTFLDAADLRWVADALAARERFTGRRAREWAEFHEAEPIADAPAAKLAVVLDCLARATSSRSRPPLAARATREALFLARGTSDAPREAVIEDVAARFRCPPEQLEQALFADVGDERRLAPLPPELLRPGTVIPRANLAIVCSLLRRATHATLRLRGNAHAFVRRARGCGLIVTVDAREAEGAPLVQLSGPLSVLRRTTLYGRALASMVETLPACGGFTLTATLLLRCGSMRFELHDRDAELPSADSVPAFDSGVEQRFARDVARLAPRLIVVREPEPVRAGSTLIFPDFALFDPLLPARRRLVEIVGFWTPEYLARKLAHVREARIEGLLLCVDDDLACGPGDVPPGSELLRFHKRVDARAALTRLGFI